MFFNQILPDDTLKSSVNSPTVAVTDPLSSKSLNRNKNFIYLVWFKQYILYVELKYEEQKNGTMELEKIACVRVCWGVQLIY